MNKKLCRNIQAPETSGRSGTSRLQNRHIIRYIMYAVFRKCEVWSLECGERRLMYRKGSLRFKYVQQDHPPF